MSAIPERTQILVVGGGPAGSYSATVLAREGFDVTVFEATKFPRYHIGESMLPSLRNFTRFIDFEQNIIDHGFNVKKGAAFKFRKDKEEGYTDFGEGNNSWNMIRSELDDILLKNAGKEGAKVFEETKATAFHFDGENPATSRAVAADYQTATGQKGTIKFEYLVDASGRNGLMSLKYLKNRKYNQSLKNMASWGYWRGVKSWAAGTPRAGAPYFQALLDESGWAWFIPLHDGTTSVGVVVHEDSGKKQKLDLAARLGKEAVSLEEHYHDMLHQAPSLLALLEGGELQTKSDGTRITQASDFSYSASQYAGPGYRMAGDAAAFIDPYFSSGVHLAFSGGLSAAASIAASIRGDCSETDAAKWHHARVSTSYTRFLVVVLAAYKQIRAQQQAILSDISEDGFAHAFDMFKPLIQGKVDASDNKLSESQLQKTMEFCLGAVQFVEPGDVAKTQEHVPEAYAKVSEKLGNPAAINMDNLKNLVADNDEDARIVLQRATGGAVMGSEIGFGVFNGEALEGYAVKMEKGKLGLVAA